MKFYVLEDTDDITGEVVYAQDITWEVEYIQRVLGVLTTHPQFAVCLVMVTVMAQLGKL